MPDEEEGEEEEEFVLVVVLDMAHFRRRRWERQREAWWTVGCEVQGAHAFQTFGLDWAAPSWKEFLLQDVRAAGERQPARDASLLRMRRHP